MNEPGSEHGGKEPGVARNTAVAALAQLVSAGCTAFLTLYLTRSLGPKKFGEFSLALGFVGVLLVPADLGISSSVGRFIAEHRRDRGTAAAFLADGLSLKLAVGLAASGGLFVVAGPLAAAYHDSQLAWPFRGVAVAMFGQSMMALYTNALVSTGRLSANLGVYTSESVTEVLASVALVALGGGATGAAFGRAAGYGVGAAAATVACVRIFGRRAIAPRSTNRRRMTQIIRYAGVLFVVNGAYALFSQIDILLIGAYVGSAQVAFFSAPLRLATLLHYPGLATSTSVAPRLARTSGAAPDPSSFQVAVRYLVILQAASVALILAWSGPIVQLLLGHRYAPAAGVLRALSPYIFLLGIGALVSASVNYLGESRRRVPIAVGAFVIDLIIDVILIPPLGAVGGAIATSAAYAVYVPAHLLLCAKLLSISLRPVLVTTLRSLTAAVAAAGVLVWVGTSHLTAADYVEGCAGGLAVFLAVLFVTGELTPSGAARAYVTVSGRLRRSQR